MSEGAWHTPLGDAGIDSEVAESLKSAMPLLSEDQEAHRYEHALEVQLPFLQVLAPGFQFVPITVGTSDFQALSELGLAIGEVLMKLGEPAMVIASSDMNHYENDSVTRTKDRRAIEQVLALDPRGLVRHGARRKYQHVRLCASDRHAHRGTRQWERPERNWSAMRRRVTCRAIATWSWATPGLRCIETRIALQIKQAATWPPDLLWSD